MDTFSIIRNALAASESDPDKVGLDDHTITTGRILAAVQTVVDALTPPDGGRYIVSFMDIGTAGTSLATRRIVVSSKPLHDRSLSMVEKAVVIATFAAHEIGHTLVTRPRGNLIREHNPHTGYHAVPNLADDLILEPHMVDRYPILEDAFAFTGLWVLRTTAKDLPKVERVTNNTTDRFNLLLNASRYPDLPDIVFPDAASIAERDWSRDWASRLIALRLTDHSGFIALCDEAWERIRETVEPQPEPEPEPEPEEAEDDEQDEDDESETEPGEDEGEDDEQDESETEPGDEQGEDEGEGGSEESEDEGEESFEQNDDPDWDDEGEDDESDDDESEERRGRGRRGR